MAGLLQICTHFLETSRCFKNLYAYSPRWSVFYKFYSNIFSKATGLLQFYAHVFLKVFDIYNTIHFFASGRSFTKSHTHTHLLVSDRIFIILHSYLFDKWHGFYNFTYLSRKWSVSYNTAPISLKVVAFFSKVDYHLQYCTHIFSQVVALTIFLTHFHESVQSFAILHTCSQKRLVFFNIIPTFSRK